MADIVGVPPIGNEEPKENEELTELRKQRAEDRETIDQLREDMRTLNQAVIRGTNPPPVAEPPKPIERDDLDADPRAVMDDHFDQRIAPIRDYQLDRDAQINKQLASNHLENWSKWEKEIVAVHNQLSKEAKAHPDAWRQCYNHVRADKLDEIIAEEKEKWTREREQGNAETAGSGLPSSGTHTPTASPGTPEPLTPIELAVAKRFKMTPEEYQKEKTALVEDREAENRRKLGLE
jgi:hypothetical protein